MTQIRLHVLRQPLLQKIDPDQTVCSKATYIANNFIMFASSTTFVICFSRLLMFLVGLICNNMAYSVGDSEGVQGVQAPHSKFLNIL